MVIATYFWCQNVPWSKKFIFWLNASLALSSRLWCQSLIALKVNRGANQYPGAKYIIRDSGERFGLSRTIHHWDFFGSLEWIFREAQIKELTFDTIQNQVMYSCKLAILSSDISGTTTSLSSTARWTLIRSLEWFLKRFRNVHKDYPLKIIFKIFLTVKYRWIEPVIKPG